MAEVIPITRSRLTRNAKQRIRALWDSGSYEFAQPHAIERLQERDLDANDIQNLIRCGRVTHGGPSDFPDTPRRYIMEGPAVDEEIIICVLDVNGSLIIVTAYPKE